MWPDRDLSSMSDRELFMDLLLGDLPKAGWGSGRGRAIARRMLEVAGLTVAIIAAVIVVSIGVLLVAAWMGVL